MLISAPKVRNTVDHEKFDKQVAAVQAQVSSLRQAMEPTLRRFLDATTAFVPQWFKQQVDYVRGAKPDVVTSAGLERMRQLKAELKQLEDRVPELVERHLNVDRLWSHKVGIPQPGRFGYSWYSIAAQRVSPPIVVLSRSPEELTKALQDIVSPLGAILDNYGLSVKTFNGWVKPALNSLPRYTGDDLWSEDMYEAIEKYSTQHQELLSLHHRIEEIEQERTKTQAQSLWDEA
jgi:hypothetical protein